MHGQGERVLLVQLAERAGIVNDYYDIGGTRPNPSDGPRRAILTAMGYAIDSAASLTQALREWDELPWQRPCDPVQILRDGGTGLSVSCCLALEEGKEGSVIVEWQIRDETNAVVQEGQAGPGLSATEIRFLNGRRHVRVEIPVSYGLSIGYYRVTVRAEGLVGGIVGTMRVIVAPRQCYAPP